MLVNNTSDLDARAHKENSQALSHSVTEGILCHGGEIPEQGCQRTSEGTNDLLTG